MTCMRRSKVSTTQVNARHKNKTHTTHASLSEFHWGSSNPPSQESKMSDRVMKCKWCKDISTARFLTIGAYLVSTSVLHSMDAIIPAFPLPPRQALRYLISFSLMTTAEVVPLLSPGPICDCPLLPTTCR